MPLRNFNEFNASIANNDSLQNDNFTASPHTIGSSFIRKQARVLSAKGFGHGGKNSIAATDHSHTFLP